MVQTRAQGRGDCQDQPKAETKKTAKAGEPTPKGEKIQSTTSYSKKRKSEPPPAGSDATPPSPKKAKASSFSPSLPSKPAAPETPELEKVVTEMGTSALDALAHLLHALLCRGRLPRAAGARALHLGRPLLRPSPPAAATRATGRRRPPGSADWPAGYATGTAGDPKPALRPGAGRKPRRIREAVREVKGMGDVGVSIVFDIARGLWPELASFVDPRGLAVAEELWEGVGRDPRQDGEGLRRSGEAEAGGHGRRVRVAIVEDPAAKRTLDPVYYGQMAMFM